MARPRRHVIGLGIVSLIGLVTLFGGLERVLLKAWWVATALQIAIGILGIAMGVLPIALGARHRATIASVIAVSVLLFPWMAAVFYESGATAGFVVSTIAAIFVVGSWVAYWPRVRTAWTA